MNGPLLAKHFCDFCEVLEREKYTALSEPGKSMLESIEGIARETSLHWSGWYLGRDFDLRIRDVINSMKKETL